MFSFFKFQPTPLVTERRSRKQALQEMGFDRFQPTPLVTERRSQRFTYG